MSPKKTVHPTPPASSRGRAPAAAPPRKEVAPPQAAFAWERATVPAAVARSFGDKFLAMHRRELLDRASLLRRLGFSQAAVAQRLESYETWEHEPYHRSQLLGEVAKLVAEVFATKSPRSTTLAPGG